jgi:putative ABC transport system permease protein
MRLALRELRRRPGRFVTATVILALVAVLVMFLGGLLDGLIRSSTGAVRAQDADLIVYSDTAQFSFLRSRIDADARSTIEAVPSVGEVGGLSVVQLGARVPGNGPRDLAGTALFGYELPPRGVPAPPANGVVYADEVLQGDGVDEGMVILLGPARTPVTVVGFVSDTSYAGQGGLWANTATWREVLLANRPDERLAPDVSQSLVVRGDGEVAPGDLASAIDDATGGATETLTVDQAVDAIPGVEGQRTTFNQIIGVTLAVATVVVALFFALLTVERLGLYGVLKAIGARTGTLFAGLVAQAVVVTSVAAAIAAALAFLLDALVPPGSVPLDVTVSRVVTSALLLLAAAIVGSAFSLHRVVRVDPAAAIGTAS